MKLLQFVFITLLIIAILLSIFLCVITFNDVNVFPLIFAGTILLIAYTQTATSVMDNVLSEPKKKRGKK